MGNSTYEEAKRYQQEGWTVIPIILKSKFPKVKWKKYQYEKPTDEELEIWFANDSSSIAICTGKCSNLCVLDIDPAHGGLTSAERLGLLPKNATVVTGSGGYHYYYRNSYNLRNFAGRWDGIDFRGEGGYVLAPPSLHPRTQMPYVWQGAPQDELPDFLLEERQVVSTGGLNGFYSSTAGKLNPRESGLHPAPVGQRNQSAARLAGGMVARGVQPDRIMAVLELWNSSNDVPMAVSELRSVLQSIIETHKRNHA